MLDLDFLIGAFAVLFSVVDPVSAVPLFLSMTQRDTPAQRRRYARNATITATAVMLFFLAFGQTVFALFSVTLTAFRIAGGLILLIIALDLLKATHTGVRMEKAEAEEGAQKNDISVTPFGIPLLGGPGAISTVMVLASQKPGSAGSINVAVAVLAVGLTIYVSLRASELIHRYLGITGINVMSRLLGLLLLAMAIQFLMDGIGEAVPAIMQHGK